MGRRTSAGAETTGRWASQLETRRTHQVVRHRSARVLDALPAVAIYATAMTWPGIHAWYEELQRLKPRMKCASAALAGARRFPSPTRTHGVVSSYTSIDPIDAATMLLGHSGQSTAKTLVRVAAALLGTVLRDAGPPRELMAPDADVPPVLVRGALVGALLLGAEVALDPRRFGYDQRDVDALAIAVALSPGVTLLDLKDTLSPIIAD